MPHYIATTNTHKIIEVSGQEASKWMQRNNTTSNNRLVGLDTVGNVRIKTFLYSNRYDSLKDIFATRRDNSFTEFYHSSTWEEAEARHKQEVLKEQLKQKK